MESKVGERCATCRHAKRLILEYVFPPSNVDMGLECLLNPNHHEFTKPWNTCDEWEPKEVEHNEWHA